MRLKAKASLCGNLPVPSAFEPGTRQSRPSVERVNKLEKPLSVRRHVPRAAALCLLAKRPLHVPCVSLKVLHRSLSCSGPSCGVSDGAHRGRGRPSRLMPPPPPSRELT